MAKELFVFKAKCFSATKNQNGTALQFAKSVENTERGAMAKEAAAINVKDQKICDLFDVSEKEYEIVVREVG